MDATAHSPRLPRVHVPSGAGTRACHADRCRGQVLPRLTSPLAYIFKHCTFVQVYKWQLATAHRPDSSAAVVICRLRPLVVPDSQCEHAAGPAAAAPPPRRRLRGRGAGGGRGPRGGGVQAAVLAAASVRRGRRPCQIRIGKTARTRRPRARDPHGNWATRIFDGNRVVYFLVIAGVTSPSTSIYTRTPHLYFQLKSQPQNPRLPIRRGRSIQRLKPGHLRWHLALATHASRRPGLSRQHRRRRDRETQNTTETEARRPKSASRPISSRPA